MVTEAEIDDLRHNFVIPAEYEIIVPMPEETLYNPPMGCICMHEQTFRCGF